MTLFANELAEIRKNKNKNAEVETIDETAMHKKYSSSKNRDYEIMQNIIQGHKNDERVKNAINNEDFETFGNIYGYKYADEGKKKIIREYYNKNTNNKVGKYNNQVIGQGNINNAEEIRKNAIKEKENIERGGIIEKGINKIQNAWDGVKWGLPEPTKMQGNTFKDAMIASGSDIINVGAYVFDKIGRTIATPFASTEKNIVFRGKNAEYNRKRDAKRYEINNTNWEQEENQSTGHWGAVKHTARQIAGAKNSWLADVLKAGGNREWAEFFDDNSDFYQKEILKNKKEIPDEFSEKLIAGGVQLFDTITTSFLTRGRPVVGASMGGYIAEYGSMKNEILNEIGDSMLAERVANGYAIGSGLLEGMFPASKVSTALREVLKGEYRQLIKQGGKEILKDGLKEGTTEAMQEVLANSYKKQLGMVESLWEGVGEAALLGAILGGGVGVVTNAETKAIYDKMVGNINNTLDIVSGKKEAQNEMEYMIAKMVIGNYQNIAKTPAVNIEMNGEKIKVETVKYEENKYSANARVENDRQANNVSFDEVFATKEEAVKNAIKRVGPKSEILHNNDIDELLRQYEEDMQRQYKDEVYNNDDMRGELERMSDDDFMNLNYADILKIQEREYNGESQNNRSNYEEEIMRRYESVLINEIPKLGDEEFIRAYSDVKASTRLARAIEKRMKKIEYKREEYKRLDAIKQKLDENIFLNEDEKHILTKEEQELWNKYQKQEEIYHNGSIYNGWEQSGSDVSYSDFLKNKLEEILNTEEAMQMLEQMSIAEAGSRSVYYAEDMSYEEASSRGMKDYYVRTHTPSTFPKWVSEKLRSRELFDWFLTNIDNLYNIPKKNTRQRQLVNDFFSTINRNYKIYEGRSKDQLDKELSILSAKGGSKKRRSNDKGAVNNDGRGNKGNVEGSSGSRMIVGSENLDRRTENIGYAENDKGQEEGNIGKGKLDQKENKSNKNPFDTIESKELNKKAYERIIKERQNEYKESLAEAKSGFYRQKIEFESDFSELDIRHALEVYPKYGVKGEENIINEILKNNKASLELKKETIEKIYYDDNEYIDWWNKNFYKRDWASEIKEKIQFVKNKYPSFYNSKNSDGINKAENNKASISEEQKKNGGILSFNKNANKKISVREKEFSLTDIYTENNPLGADDSIASGLYVSIIAENIIKSSQNIKISSDGQVFLQKINGNTIIYKKPKNARQRDFDDWKFLTDEKFSLSKNEEKFLETLQDIQIGKIQEGIIGDGKYGKIRINTEIMDKVFKKHGPFYLENLIVTANSWDYVIENRGGMGEKINLIKQFSNGKGVILAGNINENGVFAVTHYEPKDDIKTLLKKEIEKGGNIYTNNGKQIVNSYNSKNSDGINKAENNSNGEKGDFKLSNRIKEVINKLNTNYTRYVNKGAVGTFYSESGNIAIKSINDIDTVIHELSHLIDVKQNVMEQYKNDKQIMDEIEKIYLEYYSGATVDDDIDIKMREGYAVLQEKYLMIPSKIGRKYPLLVERLVKNGHPLQVQLNNDMRAIINDYQALDDIDKIGAVVNNDKNIEKESFLDWAEIMEQKLSDVVIPFVKLEEQSKNKLNVANLLYASKTINGRIYANIDNSRINVVNSIKSGGIKNVAEFWHFDEKLEIQKKEDYNWGSLIKEIGKAKKLDEFAYFLVARDQVGQYERLDRMNKKLEKMQEGEDKEKLKKRRDDVVGYLKANESILPRDMVENVHNKYYEDFRNWSAKFDKLLSYDIEFQKNVGIISYDHYNAIKRSYGYAPMRRVEDDGLLGAKVGITSIGGFKVPKMKQVKGRDGGSMEILNPLLGAIENHIETMQKGYKQMTLNNTVELMKEFPNLAQEINVVENVINGKPVYTTESGQRLELDENIITKMENGKPKAMVLNNELIQTLNSVFHPAKKGNIEKIFTGASSMFSKGTTGVYVPFFMTNMLRDQFTAIEHTKNNYIPVISQLKEVIPAVLKLDKEKAKYLEEYISLGGHQLNLKWRDAKGNEILQYLSEGEGKWGKTKRWLIDFPLDILSIPSNVSEVGTRVAEYILARKKGKTMWEALEDAGQLTAPFHHEGAVAKDSFGRGMIKSLPFLNAVMQGLAQYVRTGRTTIGKVRIGGVMSGVTAMIITSLLLLWETADEETKQKLLDMEGEEFGKAIYFPKGGGELYKLPIPQEIGFVGGMFGMMINGYYGAEYSKKDYVDMSMSWLPDQLKLNESEKMVLSWIPQLLKPAVEIAFNKTSFPKVRNIETQSMQRLASEYRYNDGTSEFAKWLGSTEVMKSMKMSPVKIDHLIGGYWGRASGYVTNKDTAYNPISSLVSKNYFASGRQVERMKNEKSHIEEMLTMNKRGLLELKEEQILEYKTRKKELDNIDDKINDYIVKSRDNTKNDEIRELRVEIYNDIDKYFKDGVVVSEFDKIKYNKQKEAEEWKSRKKDILDNAVAMYKNDDKFGAITRVEEYMKNEIKDDKKYRELKKDLFMEINYKDNEIIMKAYKASNNDEKIYLLKKIQNEIGEENFGENIRLFRRNKIFSDNVLNEL